MALTNMPLMAPDSADASRGFGAASRDAMFPHWSVSGSTRLLLMLVGGNASIESRVHGRIYNNLCELIVA